MCPRLIANIWCCLPEARDLDLGINGRRHKGPEFVAPKKAQREIFSPVILESVGLEVPDLRRLCCLGMHATIKLEAGLAPGLRGASDC